jgi:anti-sigma B factor antagonist
LYVRLSIAHPYSVFGHDSYKQFAIVRDMEPRRVTLHVFGDVDMSTVGELNEAIDEITADVKSLLIDLSKCRYFDSSGLAAAVRARKALGGRLTILVDPRSQIYRVMHLVGFEKLFNVVTELQTTCPRWPRFPPVRRSAVHWVVERTAVDCVHPRFPTLNRRSPPGARRCSGSLLLSA